MTGIVAGTFPQLPLPSNPEHPPKTIATTSIASNKPMYPFHVVSINILPLGTFYKM